MATEHENKDRGVYRELDQLREGLATANGQIADIQVQSAVNASDIKTIQENELITIKSNMKDFVSQDEFAPIKRLVWGFITTILTCVVLAVLTLILNKPPTMPPH